MEFSWQLDDSAGGAVVGVIVTVFGVAMVAMGWRHDPHQLFTIVAGVVTVGFGLVALRKPVARLLSRAAFRTATLRCVGGDPRLGGTVEVELILEPRGSLTVQPDTSTVSFISMERARQSGNKQTRTHEAIVLQEDQMLDVPDVLDSRLERRLTVRIPVKAPPSWNGRRNSLINLVRVQLDTPGRPDLILDATVNVTAECA